MVIFWESVDHFVKRMSSLYYVYLFFVFSPFGFEYETVVLITPVPGHCLAFTILSCRESYYPLRASVFGIC